MTAGDIHDIREGEVSVPVDYRDWTAAVADMLGGDEERGTVGDQ
jgi:hypothetical protein